MKKIFFLLIIFIFSVKAFSQKFSDIISDGDKAMNAGNFLDAKKKYEAAEAEDPSKREIVKNKLAVLFNKIEVQRKDALKAKMEIQAQKEIADAALAKANRLIDAYYFYDDKFALAYKNSSFYFIDKNGKPVEKLGYWREVEQFDNTGWAKVTEVIHAFDYGYTELEFPYNPLYKEGHLYRRPKKEESYDLRAVLPDAKAMLDTLGNVYPIFNWENLNKLNSFLKPFIVNGEINAENINRMIDTLYKAVEISVANGDTNATRILNNEKLEVFLLSGFDSIRNSLKQPRFVGEQYQTPVWDDNAQSLITGAFQFKNLKYLKLSDFGLNNIAPEISKLPELIFLDLSINRLTSLPEEIFSLKELMTLQLKYNNLSKLSPQINNLSNLKKMDLSYNEFTELPKEISELKNLEELDLRGNAIPKTIFKIMIRLFFVFIPASFL